jgi:DNA-binding NarL/FixJ family response regulator
MNCPTCGRTSRVLARTELPNGIVAIVRQCAGGGLISRPLHHGARFETYEVPAAVVHTLGPNKLAAVLNKSKRGDKRRALADERKAAVQKLLGKNLTNRAMAKQLKCCEARVRAIRKELEQDTATADA